LWRIAAGGGAMVWVFAGRRLFASKAVLNSFEWGEFDSIGDFFLTPSQADAITASLESYVAIPKLDAF
jgi:hypothetical protein